VAARTVRSRRAAGIDANGSKKADRLGDCWVDKAPNLPLEAWRGKFGVENRLEDRFLSFRKNALQRGTEPGHVGTMREGDTLHG
jgi:hypothetical protein